MINSKYLGSLAMSGCDWYVFCYFLFISSFFQKNLTCSKKHIQKIPPNKVSTWGITISKNGSNAHCSMQSVRSYLSLKTYIISKPFNWFAKHINCLVYILKYFRTDYNIVCVQGNLDRPLVSSSYNHGVKIIFLTRRTGEYQIKYVSRPRTLAEYQPNGKF